MQMQACDERELSFQVLSFEFFGSGKCACVCRVVARKRTSGRDCGAIWSAISWIAPEKHLLCQRFLTFVPSLSWQNALVFIYKWLAKEGVFRAPGSPRVPRGTSPCRSAPVRREENA